MCLQFNNNVNFGFQVLKIKLLLIQTAVSDFKTGFGQYLNINISLLFIFLFKEYYFFFSQTALYIICNIGIKDHCFCNYVNI